MIELNIISDNFVIDSIYINNKNNVLVKDYQTMQKLLSAFFDLSNSEITIEIGNKKLDNKKAHIINLLDYESIYSQVSFRKGSIIYDYFLGEINKKLEDVNTEINNYLENIYKPINDGSILEYNLNFEVDIVKLVTNFGIINNKMDLNKYLAILKKLLHDLIINNPRKTFIIFTNDKIIGDVIDDIEGIYIFKFFGQGPYNIFIDKEVLNFDYDTIINYMKLYWPVEKSIIDIKILLDRYIKEFYLNDISKFYEVELYIVAYLFCKVMKIDKINDYCGDLTINNSYNSFIKSNCL